jgi:hypothetical protein
MQKEHAGLHLGLLAIHKVTDRQTDRVPPFPCGFGHIPSIEPSKRDVILSSVIEVKK